MIARFTKLFAFFLLGLVLCAAQDVGNQKQTSPKPSTPAKKTTQQSKPQTVQPKPPVAKPQTLPQQAAITRTPPSPPPPRIDVYADAFALPRQNDRLTLIFPILNTNAKFLQIEYPAAEGILWSAEPPRIRHEKRNGVDVTLLEIDCFPAHARSYDIPVLKLKTSTGYSNLKIRPFKVNQRPEFWPGPGVVKGIANFTVGIEKPDLIGGTAQNPYPPLYKPVAPNDYTVQQKKTAELFLTIIEAVRQYYFDYAIEDIQWDLVVEQHLPELLYAKNESEILSALKNVFANLGFEAIQIYTKNASARMKTETSVTTTHVNNSAQRLIRINTVENEAVVPFENLLSSLDLSDTLYLDLRGAHGNSFEAAADIFAQLIASNTPMCTLQSRNGDRLLRSSARKTVYTGHIILLIDQQTSGSAEILAAALSRTNCVTTYGTHSSGKPYFTEDLPIGSEWFVRLPVSCAKHLDNRMIESCGVRVQTVGQKKADIISVIDGDAKK